MPFQIVRVLFLHEHQKIVVADLGLHLLVEQARPLQNWQIEHFQFGTVLVGTRHVVSPRINCKILTYPEFTI